MRFFLIIFLLVPLALSAQRRGEPMPKNELKEFLGPVAAEVINWTKVEGPDFVVYYGEANPPLSGAIGFYLGGWPSFKPEPNSKLIAGKLGIFPVHWHRATASDGSVRQNALMRLDDYWQVDIWAKAKRQEDLDGLLKIIAQLPTFTKKPKPVGTQ